MTSVSYSMSRKRPPLHLGDVLVGIHTFLHICEFRYKSTADLKSSQRCAVVITCDLACSKLASGIALSNFRAAFEDVEESGVPVAMAKEARKLLNAIPDANLEHAKSQVMTTAHLCDDFKSAVDL
eukprot:CAMPEP_0118725472 /NCGR_PEP_ID=MMETSP0800-20121206/33159_1 /TAXON_ID=210618 ORGANISM="Striatella unipunctata, Strain CCMP2910" /NCGR_SAMPLE_ID=MMETSP0800 /ASSEMBLY_ACC=CAM_ASM_000638 /LENGTH=124 /DNA_ID=CAMNT_0006634175 /DNA_START=257 /DNA_END=632 /DNA_ORIENTATION=+